jgi:hypothetical protein
MTIIISKFLNSIYPNSHPLIYLFIKGDFRRQKIVIQLIMDTCKLIFLPVITEEAIEEYIKDFLNNKKNEYYGGFIKIKSIY